MTIEVIRTLFISRDIPFHSKGGGSLRNWQNINLMMKYGPVAVFSACNWTPKTKLLTGVALWKHCNVAQQRSSWEQFKTRLWWLRPMGDPDADWAYSQKAALELEIVLKEFKPDLVVFVEVWLFPYLSVVKRYPCRIVFDNHNVEAHLFQQKYSSPDSLNAKIKTKIRLNHLKKIEKKLSHQSDQVWLCSEEDTKLLQSYYGQEITTYVVPNGVNIYNYESARLHQCSLPSGLENPERTIMFLGQLSYPPNQVAGELLLEEIYPKLKKIEPNCRLLLVGRSPTKKMVEAAKTDSNIVVTGKVPDIQPYLAAASVMIVPLLQGGGTRLKILEAFACGCPVISTKKGAEGLKAIDGQHILIRDSVDEIIEGICQLWSDPSLKNKLIDAAYELVKNHYSWEAVSQNVEKAVKQLF